MFCSGVNRDKDRNVQAEPTPRHRLAPARPSLARLVLIFIKQNRENRLHLVFSLTFGYRVIIIPRENEGI